MIPGQPALLLQSRQDTLGGDGMAHAHARGIVDRVGDRARRRTSKDLAKSIREWNNPVKGLRARIKGE
jgi:hypothetical protein